MRIVTFLSDGYIGNEAQVLNKIASYRFVSNIIADTDRMKVLVDRLLELARADNPTLTPQSGDLLDVLKRLQSRYQNLVLDFKSNHILPVMIAEELSVGKLLEISSPKREFNRLHKR